MRRYLLTAALAIFPSAPGCEGTSYSLTRRLDSGREVAITSYKIARRRGFDSTADTTVVRIGPRRVTIEPTRIEVDGDLVATIDEETKYVAVFEQWDKLRIIADEVTVYEGPFAPTDSAPATP